MKAVLLLVTGFAGGIAWLGLGEPEPPADGPETVTIPAGVIAFRQEGNFEYAGKTATPMARHVKVPAFEIMVRQVSQADHAACVSDGACKATPATGYSDSPQTHLSWYDAQAYAEWLSDRTGATWRLPSDREWQRAAAEGFGEVAPAIDGRDPGQRILERYDARLRLRGQAERTAHETGRANSLGLQGVVNTVWEWTDGCMATGTLDADGKIVSAEPYCAARIVGGQYRAVVMDFIRDASVGGCAVGLPPDYLGVRLVRD